MNSKRVLTFLALMCVFQETIVATSIVEEKTEAEQKKIGFSSLEIEKILEVINDLHYNSKIMGFQNFINSFYSCFNSFSNPTSPYEQGIQTPAKPHVQFNDRPRPPPQRPIRPKPIRPKPNNQMPIIPNFPIHNQNNFGWSAGHSNQNNGWSYPNPDYGWGGWSEDNNFENWDGGWSSFNKDKPFYSEDESPVYSDYLQTGSKFTGGYFRSENARSKCLKVGTKCGPSSEESQSNVKIGKSKFEKCCNKDSCENSTCCIPSTGHQHSACSSDSQCCNNGICDLTTKMCYIKSGKKCSDSKSCMNTLCTENKCCNPAKGIFPCSDSIDCCTGQCSDGFCKASSGESCHTDFQCVSNKCNNLVC